MDLTAFLADNALKVKNESYAVSERFLDSNGEPVKWEIRAISGEEDDALRRTYTRRVRVPGKKNQYTTEIDFNAYVAALLVTCTVFPNLNDTALQDSYHVMGAEKLLKAMLTAGEYANYADKVQQVCGFTETLQDEVDEAKNL